MKTNMRFFRVQRPKAAPHAFVESKKVHGQVYAEYGLVKTFSDIGQAAKKVNQLCLMGHDCMVSDFRPFVIIKSEAA